MGRTTKVVASTPKPKAAKRSAPSDEVQPGNKPSNEGESTFAENPSTSGWAFLKPPSSSQLKKPKKASQRSDDDVEFPPLSEADTAVFDDILPLTKAGNTNDSLRILAWNVNGLRAVLKKDNYFRAYIARENPDVLCLSETKIDDAALGQVQILPQYPHQYWNCADQKGSSLLIETHVIMIGQLFVGYAGTAVFSKVEPLSVRTSLVVAGQPDNEGRFVALEFSSFWLVHTYVPNAGQKLERFVFICIISQYSAMIYIYL
ncbi:hypothetical protein DYB30_011601 [Aphanomyces astaci]|uniref:Endonuclease/exonuclease/phosphatase domain-containing protein n=1 Tax=Aphanomyces astaci TaxID=112090 RepID=A0A397CJS0_APHAT|nr:hypothetical protein DYB30_011601 [Aphanomyces astaci]